MAELTGPAGSMTSFAMPFFEQLGPGDVESKPHQRRTLALEIYADPATPDVTEEKFHLATVSR